MQNIEDNMIPMTEMFVSISGEGTSAGRMVSFVRTAECNLRCSYCDTKYSYKAASFMTTEDILEQLAKNGCKSLVLTGGEPLYGKPAKRNLALSLAKNGYNVYIETNGSCKVFSEEEVAGIRDNIHYVLDYKSKSSGMEEHDCLADNINLLNETDDIKFVVGTVEDFNRAIDVINKYKEELSARKVTLLFSCIFNQMKPKDLVELLKDKISFFEENNLRMKLSLQLHKFIWDPNEKGV